MKCSPALLLPTVFLLPVFLLTGCGDDRPYVAPAGPPPQARTAPTAPADVPPPDAPAEPSPSGTVDPLLGDAKPSPSDPLLGHDPLRGRAMPTKHSHWLRGRLRDARVTVLLNGMRHGTFSGILDQDITMKLRQGVNTVTFIYQPESVGAAADLEIVESEHHPPIAPLVTFHDSSREVIGFTPGADELKPVTQAFPFVAN